MQKSCTKYLYYNIVKNKNQQTRKVDFLTKSVKNGNIVMKFNDAFTSRDTYVLEMNNQQNEIIGLLLVMAVEIALNGNE